MKRKIDISTWNRKPHFELFQNFEEPYFGLVAEVDCTHTYKKAKKENDSFFISYLHKILKALNQVEEFKYRIIDDEIYVFDVINGSSTIAREDNTFGFSYLPYVEDYSDFKIAAKKEIDRVKQTKDLEFADEQDIIHFTTLPWLRFSSLSHPRIFSKNQSIPKISTGKLTEENGKLMMPVAVHAHHGLVDGYHASEFYRLFQEILNS